MTTTRLMGRTFQDITHPDDLEANLAKSVGCWPGRPIRMRWRSGTSARTARRSGSTWPSRPVRARRPAGLLHLGGGGHLGEQGGAGAVPDAGRLDPAVVLDGRPGRPDLLVQQPLLRYTGSSGWRAGRGSRPPPRGVADGARAVGGVDRHRPAAGRRVPDEGQGRPVPPVPDAGRAGQGRGRAGGPLVRDEHGYQRGEAGRGGERRADRLRRRTAARTSSWRRWPTSSATRWPPSATASMSCGCGDDPSAVAEARTLMERQVEQMVRLVDDLLDVSPHQPGKLELRKERVDLAARDRAAVETGRPLDRRDGARADRRAARRSRSPWTPTRPGWPRCSPTC